MPTAYWPAGGQLEAGDGAEERVRDLREDAGAVAGAGVGADRAAVLQVAQRVEGGVDDVVPGGAAQGGDHRQAAGVLLAARVVEALRRGNGAEPSERTGWSASERHGYRPHDGAAVWDVVGPSNEDARPLVEASRR